MEFLIHAGDVVQVADIRDVLYEMLEKEGLCVLEFT